MTHHITTWPITSRYDGPGPVVIVMHPADTRGKESGCLVITAGGNRLSVNTGVSGTWPTPVEIDPATFAKLRQPWEVKRMEITYIDGNLEVQPVEFRPPRLPWQPLLDFGYWLPIQRKPKPVAPAPSLKLPPLQFKLF